MDLTNFIQPIFWIKSVTLILIGFYVIFTFVVFTQVKTMSHILSLSSTKAILRTISIIHIFVAVSLFLFAIVIL